MRPPFTLTPGATQRNITRSIENANLDPGSITDTMDDGKSADCVLGDVWLTANTYGSATIADGRILSVTQNAALFALMGTRYGGDGIYTFALPDLTYASPAAPSANPSTTSSAP